MFATVVEKKCRKTLHFSNRHIGNNTTQPVFEGNVILIPKNIVKMKIPMEMLRLLLGECVFTVILSLSHGFKTESEFQSEFKT